MIELESIDAINLIKSMNRYIYLPVKSLIIASMFLLPGSSLFAQGQIVVGSVISQLAWNDTAPQALPSWAIPDTSDWVSPRTLAPRPDSSRFHSSSFAYEGNRSMTQNDGEISLPSLPASPISDALSGAPALFQPNQFQSSSLTIQAVPEPSSVALGGLSLGLIAAARSFRNGKKLKC